MVRSCSAYGIKVLGEQRIFERFFSCAVDQYYIDPSSCISSLPLMVETVVNALDESCKSCFFDLMGSISSSAKNGELTSVLDACMELSGDGVCLTNGNIVSSLSDFHLCGGWSITYPTCSQAEVRTNFFNGALNAVVQASTGNYDILSSLELRSTDCGYCYFDAVSYLSVFTGNNPTLLNTISDCAALVSPDANCLTTFADFFDYFRTCAGFDIYHTGPECTSQEIGRIEAISPYHTLTSCAFTPQDSSCGNIQSYIDQIVSASNPNCGTCFQEYYIGLTDIKAVYSVGARCENVMSAECVGWNSEQVTRLGKCTGFAVLID